MARRLASAIVFLALLLIVSTRAVAQDVRFVQIGGQRVLDAAAVLPEQSGIPEENLTLIDRQETYSHNDPNSAHPTNEFVDALVPFLESIE